MTTARLKRMASSFRDGLLSGRDSDLMCAAVCYPLQGFLSMLGVETTVEELDFGITNHVILRLQDDIYKRWIAKQLFSQTTK